MTHNHRLIAHTAVAFMLVLSVSGCSLPISPGGLSIGKNADTVGVNIVPAHHLGKNYSIEDVYVNGQWGGNAGRGGGGGGYVCCVMLPEIWRSGLVAKIKWRVIDWRQENKDETKAGIFKSILDEGSYVATVPVEYYAEPGDLYIHFFSEGRVRAVSSLYSLSGKRHPISKSPEEQDSATKGLRLNKAGLPGQWKVGANNG